RNDGRIAGGMSRTLRTTIGVLLSLLLLAWALRDVSFSEVLLRIRAADPVLLTISIVVTLMGFYIRALRWGILLAPVQASIPYRPRLAATFIGFAANNVLPARIGEFARAFSLSRLVRIRTASAFATLVVERLLDALVLVALLFLSMAAPGFPENVRIAGIDLRQSAIVMAVVMVAVGIVLLLGVVYRDKAAWMFHLGAKRLPA